MSRTEDEEFIIGTVFLLANKLNQIGDNILPDITFKQFILLITIQKMNVVEKNINSIADFVGTTRQNVKKMLSFLEMKGYVAISKSEQDARALDIQLTEKTLQYFSVNETIAANEANQLFSPFSNSEISNFTRNLQKLVTSFEEYSERIKCNE